MPDEFLELAELVRFRVGVDQSRVELGFLHVRASHHQVRNELLIAIGTFRRRHDLGPVLVVVGFQVRSYGRSQ